MIQNASWLVVSYMQCKSFSPKNVCPEHVDKSRCMSMTNCNVTHDTIPCLATQNALKVVLMLPFNILATVLHLAHVQNPDLVSCQFGKMAGP